MWGGRCKGPVSGRRLVGKLCRQAYNCPWEAGPRLRGDNVGWPYPSRLGTIMQLL